MAFGLSRVFFGEKRPYSYNTPDYSYYQNYVPGAMEGYLDPNNPDWMGYGQYQGFNAKPNYLELMFQDRDITDTDYRVMNPYSQQWQQFEDQSQIRDYLSQNATGQFATDLAGMDDTALMNYLKDQGWSKESYEYGDPYSRSLYYTPYDLALGGAAGWIPGMESSSKTKDINYGAIRPDVGYDYWNNADLVNLGSLSGLPTGLQDLYTDKTNPDYTRLQEQYQQYVNNYQPSDISIHPGIQTLSKPLSFEDFAKQNSLSGTGYNINPDLYPGGNFAGLTDHGYTGTNWYDPVSKVYDQYIRDFTNGVDWQDNNTPIDWSKGFITSDNPWDYGYQSDYDTTTGTYRGVGVAKPLSMMLSMIPGMQWVGAAVNAADTKMHGGDWGDAALSFVPALLGQFGQFANPATQSGMLAAQEAGMNTLGWMGATTGTQGALNAAGLGSLGTAYSNLSPYITNTLYGGVKSYLGGGDFATGALGGAIGTGANEYLAPVFKSALADMGLSSDIASGLGDYLTNLGTSAATSYLSTLGDDDSYNESTSRLVSNTTPTYGTSFTEGLASGYGLPQWMQPQQQPQQTAQQARGRMTSNQLGGSFDPEKQTQFMVG